MPMEYQLEFRPHARNQHRAADPGAPTAVRALAEVPFFDVRRERIWVFWRRVLHTSHHRAQLGLGLRLLEDRVPPTYGPTADVTWPGADPTATLDAARRRGT